MTRQYFNYLKGKWIDGYKPKGLEFYNLMDQLNDMDNVEANNTELLQSVLQGEFDEAALQADFKNKLEAAEANYAPRLTNLEKEVKEVYNVQYTLQSMLLNGEVLPNDGVLRADIIIQRAINELYDIFSEDNIPKVLFIPYGKYKLEDSLNWKTGIGLIGETEENTILLPYGNKTAILGNQTGNFEFWFENCIFENFTIDGINQNSTPADSWVKGIFIQFMKDCKFKRVTVKNTWMTGFGLDYLNNVSFDKCTAEGCGRGGTNNTGAGAGFGIATGMYDVELCKINDCVSRNNKTHGFFTENKFGKGVNVDKFSEGFSMNGCIAYGNYEGFRDGGSSSALISNCQFIENTSNGVAIGKTPANLEGGINGIISNCIIERNLLDGISIEELSKGSYTICNNQISNNRYGIVRKTPGGSILDIQYGFTIKNNLIKNNKGSGICLLTTSKVNRLNIQDNEIVNNGTNTSIANRDGITIYSSLDSAKIINNSIYNDVNGITQNGIWLRGNVETYIPVIQKNETTDLKLNNITLSHIINDERFVKDNYSLKEKTFFWSENFIKENGDLTGRYTSTGGFVWKKSGNGNIVIENNEMKFENLTSNFVSFVDNTKSDGTLEAKCKSVGVESLAVLMFRGVSQNNYLGVKARNTISDRKWTLVKRISGTESIISVLDAPSNDNDIVKVEFYGENVKIYINNEIKFDGVVTDQSTRSGCGMLAGASSMDSVWEYIDFNE